MPGGLGSPSKADPVHQRVTGQCTAAGLTMASHYIENPRREARFLKDLGELKHGGRRMFRGFQYHGIACGKCGTDFHGDEKQLGIPGHHSSYHAERLTDGHRHHVRLVDRQGFPSDLVGQAGIVLKEVRNVIRLPARFLKQLARIDCFAAAERFRMFGQHFSKTAQHLASGRRRHGRPGAFAKRMMCGFHRAVDIRF